MNICLVVHKYGVPLDDPCAFPLGYMYVSSELKEMGHNVKVLNYNLWDYDLREELKGQDYVLFTGFEEFLPYIERDATIARETGVRSMLGGALANFCTEKMQGIVDEVFLGEFDKNVPIDSIPFPDYDGFGIAEYHRRNRERHIMVMTARGCPYHCTFCAHTCKYRERTIDSVFAEVDHYRERYNPDMFVFCDNTMNVRKSRFMEICRQARERKIQWSAAIRCDVWDEEMTAEAQRSGLTYLVVGVESFNQGKLDRMRKGVTREQIINTLDLLEKYGINYHGNILVGLDGETYEDIAGELADMPSGYNIFPAMVQPFIGTAEGRNRALSNEEYQYLDGCFRDFVYEQGKYCYPELVQ